MLINIIDYPTIQAALDHANAGDRVYLGAGSHIAPDGGWVIRESITVMGDIGPDASTAVAPAAGGPGRDAPVFAVEPRPGHGHIAVLFQDLTFIARAALPAVIVRGDTPVNVSLAFDSVLFRRPRETKTQSGIAAGPTEASRC